MFIPPGFNSVTAYFYVDDARAFIEFDLDGLGDIDVLRSLREDGRIANEQIQLGSSTVMVSQRPPSDPQMRAACYVYVEDADTAMVRADRVGAQQILSVQDMEYGDRQGGVSDAHGNIWWISQRLKDGRTNGLLDAATLRWRSS